MCWSIPTAASRLVKTSRRATAVVPNEWLARGVSDPTPRSRAILQASLSQMASCWWLHVLFCFRKCSRVARADPVSAAKSTIQNEGAVEDSLDVGASAQSGL